MKSSDCDHALTIKSHDCDHGVTILKCEEIPRILPRLNVTLLHPLTTGGQGERDVRIPRVC